MYWQQSHKNQTCSTAKPEESLLNRDHCFHSSFQRRNVCFHIQQAAFYVSESEKTSCPTQLNSVSKKHFLLLEGRRLGFCQGRWPGCAGPRGQVWCILLTPSVGGVCREMRGLEPFHNRRVPGGLDLLLLWVMHAGQEDRQWTREERTQTRGIMH